MKKGKPIIVKWNDGSVKEYRSKADASRQLEISTTLISSFIAKERPREIIKIEYKEIQVKS